MSNFNSAQHQPTGPILQNKNVSALIDEALNCDNIIVQLNKAFIETIKDEEEQHKQELLEFINTKIELLSGAGLQ